MLIDIFRSAKRYWHIEILGGLDKPFKWRRLFLKCHKINRYRYLFWFRLAYAMHQQDSKFWRRRGKLLNERISRQFNVEIMLGASIGEGLWIAHPNGIVITSHAIIGKDFRIWQNCTLGIKGQREFAALRIGDGVRVHAHACIISDDLELGDNVIIGAGAFVNKSVPSNHMYITKSVGEMKRYDPQSMGRLQNQTKKGG
ncbi:serine acetyltransferase [Pseudomonas sp. Fig-3]|jgi:serine acetyltransferase|uniref:serine acetyltransferase n=1 Tax=Pseudomonas TaxID=286 RepID=UPI0010EE2204|nr:MULTISPECIES: serine acetyltransferase [unclassified Pseudomonas]MBD0705775.1 serine acetyltransferase [Pseudomonas sp. PSB1]MDR8389240.1 serine acetyltransferase [Pseudomonas sp. JL2]TNB90415.1 serine acetyltransferase [Pseudomonas sp. Fig-3]WNZ78982.1 serine acetyltransferase [Pseudomonas sp. P105]VII89145.1 Serine acetyltransferase (EC 2.3.1.30) [Pseudomonas sp. FG-3G]